jgi:hypothetical protein
MTRPAGRRRLPALCLALLCLCVLVARCGGDATAALRLQAGQAPSRRSVARRFGLPRRLAQAGGEGDGGEAELDSSALAEEDDSSSSSSDELLDESDQAGGLGESDSSTLGAGEGDNALDGSSDSSSDALEGSSDESSSSDGLELFDDEDDSDDDDGFDWSSDLRLWGEEDGDDDDSDDFDAQGLLDDSALFSDDGGFFDDAYFDFWADDDELPPDLGAPARRSARSPLRVGFCSERRFDAHARRRLRRPALPGRALRRGRAGCGRCAPRCLHVTLCLARSADSRAPCPSSAPQFRRCCRRARCPSPAAGWPAPPSSAHTRRRGAAAVAPSTSAPTRPKPRRPQTRASSSSPPTGATGTSRTRPTVTSSQRSRRWATEAKATLSDAQSLCPPETGTSARASSPTRAQCCAQPSAACTAATPRHRRRHHHRMKTPPLPAPPKSAAMSLMS